MSIDHRALSLLAMLLSVSGCDCGKSDPTPPGDPCDEDADCDDPVSPWCVMMRCVQCRNDGDCTAGQSCDANACVGDVADSSVDSTTDTSADGGDAMVGCVGAPPACCDPLAGTIDAQCVSDVYECPSGSTLGACTTDAGIDGGEVDGGACLLLDNGEPCSEGAECCSGSCPVESLTCACVGDGVSCGRDADCCGGSCVDGTCASTSTCSSAGTTCAGSFNQCCSAMDLVCAANECRGSGTCTAELESCTSGGECCSGMCVRENPMDPGSAEVCTCHDLAVPDPAPSAISWTLAVGAEPDETALPSGTIREGVYTVAQRELWASPPGPPGPAVLRVTQVDHHAGDSIDAFILQLTEQMQFFIPFPGTIDYTETATLQVSSVAGDTRLIPDCGSPSTPSSTFAMRGRATFTASDDEIILIWNNPTVDATARVTFDYLGP